MRRGLRFPLALAVLAALAASPRPAEAGFLDKLNEMNKKMEEKNQQMQQKNAAQGVGGGGSLSAGLGATNLDGLTIFGECMDQAANVHERLQAQVLRRRLRTNPGSLNAKQSKEVEEDIAWLDTTATAGRAPHPKPQRWLLVMTDDEQMEVNSTANRYNEDVRQKCDAKYGGMSNYSNAAGAARRAAVNAKVPFPDLEHATPATFAKEPTAMDDYMTCVKAGQGIRWQVTADVMQAKMDRLNPSGPARKAWEEDIAVVRAAAQNPTGPAMPQSPDPTNPMRYMTRLDGNEQMAVSTEYAAASQAHQAKCSAPTEQAEKTRNRKQGEEVAKQAREQAAANVKSQKVRAEREAKAAADRAKRGGGGSLSASLGATDLRYMQEASKCHDPIKGHMAKATAEMLERKLKDAKGLAPEKRRQWEEDIAAWRTAEAAGADLAIPPDLDNPYRWQDWLTKTDRQQINSQHSAFVNEVNKKCLAVDHMNAPTKLQ